MRRICLIVLAGLASACSDTADEPASGPTGRELADAGGDVGADTGEGAVAANADPIVDNASGTEPAAPGGSGAAPSATGQKVGSLPLRLGFYVAADVSCAQASNATLQLLRRDGINTSRTPCDFEKIEQLGATSFRVTESCSEGFGGADEAYSTTTAIYEIQSETRFKVVGDSWESTMQYCAQSSLPEPWRDNDISDITG